MSIEWFRDLALCILGLGVTIVAILIGVLALLCYLKLRPVMNSLKATTKIIEDVASSLEEEISGPLAQLAGFIRGVRQAVGVVSNLAKGKGGRKHE